MIAINNCIDLIITRRKLPLLLNAKWPPSSFSNQLHWNYWVQCTNQLGSFVSTFVAEPLSQNHKS